MQYADLFSSTSIVDSDSIDLNAPAISASNVMDVDLDECVVINTARDGFDSIGTTGLSNCIALCARGVNDKGETILGVSHYSGSKTGNTEPRQALQELKSMMDAHGARNTAMHLVGGMISKTAHLNSLDRERGLLSLRHTYNIQGAKLHLSTSTDINDAGFVNALMTPERVYYSEDDLYES